MANKALVKSFLTYVVPFFAIFVGLYALYAWLEPAMEHYYAALATSVCAVIGLFDAAVSCHGNIVHYADVPSLAIVAGCDGVTFIVLIVAAVLPFPASARAKAIGLAVLIPVLLGFNWLRLLVLGLIRFYLPDAFNLVHVYIYQPVMIVFTIAVFVLWIAYSDKQSTPS
jgi:exosortase/archaeosortase family protein